MDTGSVTLTMYDVVDMTSSITVGGAAVNVSLNTPGQNGLLTFQGSGGQLITIHGTANTVGGTVALRVLRPDGSTHYSGTWSGTSFDQTISNLSVNGTYTLIVDPSGANTGSVNISLTSP